MSNGITISRLFGKSPFAALQAHMIVVLECAREVKPLIEAVARGDEAMVNAAKEITRSQEILAKIAGGIAQSEILDENILLRRKAG